MMTCISRLCLAICVICLSACDPPTPTPQSVASGLPAVPTHFAPVAYFDQHCAQCHGPHGSFYGDEFARRSDTDLRNSLRQMSEGPAGAPLTDPQFEILVAYHQALGAGRAYAVLVETTGGGTSPLVLNGETGPNTRVKIITPGLTIPADQSGSKWTVSLPPKTALRQVGIIALPQNPSLDRNQQAPATSK